mgnify:CR=1 FL=1
MLNDLRVLDLTMAPLGNGQHPFSRILSVYLYPLRLAVFLVMAVIAYSPFVSPRTPAPVGRTKRRRRGASSRFIFAATQAAVSRTNGDGLVSIRPSTSDRRPTNRSSHTPNTAAATDPTATTRLAAAATQPFLSESACSTLGSGGSHPTHTPYPRRAIHHQKG